VLEPSPPALDQPPWFADDPVAAERDDGDEADKRRLVSPVSTGDLLWDELAAEDEQLAAWCGERWLGACRRLAPAGPGLAGTRTSLQALAEHVVSAARRRANGKIGLRFTRGGFGTPFFGEDTQVRVAGDVLIVQSGDRVRSDRPGTLGAAAELVGVDLEGGELQAARALDVDMASAQLLGDWFGFAASALEQLRAEHRRPADSGRVQLWPEHFDMAVDLGAPAVRATYGCSPGDDRHPEPYLYVLPHGETPGGDLWRASGFSGAELPYATLLEASEQRDSALAFFRVRRDALSSGAMR
jgi:hypothetical protein